MSDGGPLVAVLCVHADAEWAERVGSDIEASEDRLVATATGATSAPERLAAESYDCVVVGHDEGFDCVPTVERCRGTEADVPAVVFAADGSERVASDALRAGAADYLPAEEGSDALAGRVLAAAERSGRYRAAFEKALDAMVIADDEGRYVDANRAARDLFGAPRSGIVGESVGTFVPEGFDLDGAWKDFGDERAQRGTIEIRRPDGGTRTVEYAAVADIVPGEHLSVLRDVTEREEQRVELERQNERLDRFAGVISHDLRNPLSTAAGYLELAEETGEEEYFRRVARSHDRIERIIDDLLFLAREGREIGSTEPVDVAGLVERAWELVADGNGEAELVVAGDLGTVEADDDRFRQLLENVFRNAVEHGGPDVTVRAAPIDGGIAIEDDGPGIPEDEREAVFEHGYSTREGGTGFGLHIVERVADAHGWSVAMAESESGGARIELNWN
jgi:PAS domain S-box-containing protein